MCYMLFCMSKQALGKIGLTGEIKNTSPSFYYVWPMLKKEKAFDDTQKRRSVQRKGITCEHVVLQVSNRLNESEFRKTELIQN